MIGPRVDDALEQWQALTEREQQYALGVLASMNPQVLLDAVAFVRKAQFR
ncbi:hypothetical protein [Rhodococcus tibetensis]|uniref:Uncharacterized protein n=1 Tax=Rhodococcus tibetensis TaxID=2965064 RepID=A0ABT1QDN3_9NOCA|nr:hypothetical protein [Rhodococcus sp. FXJ9.536]MCQ4120399.1 hypothetical protein [Rhodococcus sp. FXJ9.536]